MHSGALFRTKEPGLGWGLPIAHISTSVTFKTNLIRFSILQSSNPRPSSYPLVGWPPQFQVQIFSRIPAVRRAHTQRQRAPRACFPAPINSPCSLVTDITCLHLADLDPLSLFLVEKYLLHNLAQASFLAGIVSPQTHPEGGPILLHAKSLHHVLCVIQKIPSLCQMTYWPLT
jgi:hypothetical protein